MTVLFHPLRALVLAFVITATSVASGATLEIALRHTFHGEPLMLDSLRYANSAGETMSFTRLSYLLSGFALEGDNGTWIELPERSGSTGCPPGSIVRYASMSARMPRQTPATPPNWRPTIR